MPNRRAMLRPNARFWNLPLCMTGWRLRMRRGYVPRLGLRQEIERIAAEKNTRRSRLWGFVALSSIELGRDSLLTGGFLGSACQIRPEECPKELISSAMFSFTV